MKEKAKAFEGSVCGLNVVRFAICVLTLGIAEIFGGVSCLAI